MIVFGSRPSVSHHRSSTDSCASSPPGRCRRRSTRPAYFAAARRVRFSPRPPIQMGMRGWTGFGFIGSVHHAEVRALEGDARCSGRGSCRRSARIPRDVSPRGPIEGNGTHRPWASTLCQPGRARSPPAVGEMVDRGERLWRAALGSGRRRSRRRCRGGSARVHGRGGERGDRSLAVESPPRGGDSWKLVETENQSKPCASANCHRRASRRGAAIVTDMDPEVHGTSEHRFDEVGAGGGEPGRELLVELSAVWRGWRARPSAGHRDPVEIRAADVEHVAAWPRRARADAGQLVPQDRVVRLAKTTVVTSSPRAPGVHSACTVYMPLPVALEAHDLAVRARHRGPGGQRQPEADRAPCCSSQSWGGAPRSLEEAAAGGHRLVGDDGALGSSAPARRPAYRG